MLRRDVHRRGGRRARRAGAASSLSNGRTRLVHADRLRRVLLAAPDPVARARQGLHDPGACRHPEHRAPRADPARQLGDHQRPRRLGAPLGRQPLDHPGARVVAGSAAGRAGGPGAPARTRRCRARPAGRPSAAGAARASPRDGARPAPPDSASSSARDATTFDCGLAAAESCEPRGRVAEYASDSSSDTTLTAPVTRTWRWSASHGKHERGARVGERLAALARRPVREEHEAALVEALEQHRARGRAPDAFAVANSSRSARARAPRPPRRTSAAPARSRSARGRASSSPRERVGLAHRARSAARRARRARSNRRSSSPAGRRRARCGRRRAARPCSTAPRASRSARTASMRAIGPGLRIARRDARASASRCVAHGALLEIRRERARAGPRAASTLACRKPLAHGRTRRRPR